MTTYDADALHLDHREGCHSPRHKLNLGDRGDLLLRCRTCKALRVLPPDTLEDPAAVLAPAPYAGSSWSCREHMKPVNWRGKGCPDCARRSKKRARR